MDRSREHQRHNVPALRTRLIGREHDVASLRRVVLEAEGRLVTLTGIGGCGKTRLALEIALELADTFAQGVWLVDFAPLSDPSLVPQAVAMALDVREQPGRPLLETVVASLRPQRLLLVLDNCEHLVEGCAHLVDTVLSACPSLRVLATSREALRVQGEITWRVPPLAVPDLQQTPSVDQLLGSPAVRLFADRARAVQSGFELTPQSARSVARLCAQLDGLPLAIELAAARTNVLTVEQIAARLADRFGLLASGGRTAVPRQRTLRASVDWSYDLLSEEERRLLRRLSIFAGGWTLEAAEAVCSNQDLPARNILDLLAGLVDKSLALATERDDARRYGLLETLREYGQDRLREAGEDATLRRRLAEWCLALVEEAAPFLEGAEQAQWLACLEGERDNVRSALAWCETEDGAGSAHGLRMLDVLGHVWFKRQQQTEGRRWIDRILRIDRSPASPVRVRVLNWGAEFTMHQGDIQRSDELAEEALQLSRNLGYTSGEGVALTRLGSNADSRCAHERAVVLLEEALRISLQASDDFGIWYARNNLAEALRHEGKLDPSTILIEENLALATRRGDGWALAQAVRQLGLVAEAKEEYTRAAELLEESLALFQAIGAARGRHWVLLELGRVVLAQGDSERARVLMGESLRLCREAWAVREIARCLEGLASVAATTGRASRAASLFGAAVALRERTDLPPYPSDRTACARGLAAARDQLDDEAFAQGWDEGRTMPLEQAIVDAEELVGPVAPSATKGLPGAPESVIEPSHASGHQRRSGRLTARQAEVLHLVAEGKTDRQIAAELVLSEKTVGRHLENIFARLGVSSRTAASVIALRQGIQLNV